MREIGPGAGKAHLELARHLFRLDKMHEILGRSLRPRQHIKVFVRLHARQRRAHDVAREIAAAAHRHNPGLQRAFHDGAHRIAVKIVQLNGLAGGKMRARHVVFANRLGDERQLFLRHAARRHAQTQHAGLAVLLRIAAVQARKALVRRLRELSCIKLRGLFPECGHIFLPLKRIDLFHQTNPPFWFSLFYYTTPYSP